jgi:hypothetical protein
MSTTTATTADTTTYSLTSKLSRVITVNPATVTLTYTNNIEIDTVQQGNTPGFGTTLFLANLSSSTLSNMADLANSALAVGGQATLHYQVVAAGTTPSGSQQMVAVITSLSYNGKTVNA